jgi:uncharacterized protein YbjT (DUF2867 family)
MSEPTTVLVTGITGKQGGAAAEALHAKGFKVRGLTRNPDSDTAKALTARGFEILQGDFNDQQSLERAVHGADAVFSMGTFFEAGLDAETAQGIAVADAAKKEGAFLVYSSVASADKNTGVPHFESKYRVEQHIKSIGVPHTIIAPVYFMENIYFPQTKEALDSGTYATPLPTDMTLQQVAVADIGNFAALAIERRDEFEGKRIDIASDTVSGTAEAELLGKALGKEVGYYQVPMEDIRAMSEEMAAMYQWFIDTGYSVDTDALRRTYPEVGWHTLETWISEQKLN